MALARPAQLAATIVAFALAACTHAQLIGPIPAPTPPTPEYVPGPRTPVVEPPPPVPEVAPIAPSLVERTAEGRLKPIVGTPDEAAVAKYPFDEVQRTKIAKSAEARRLDLDRFVAANVEKVIAARKLRVKVETATEFAPLFEARDAVVALRTERLLDRLLRDGAISMAHKARLEEAVLEYERARKDDLEKASGGDPTRTAILHLRQSFADATREPFESLDRQLDHIADHFERVMARSRGDDPAKPVPEPFRAWAVKGNADPTEARIRRESLRAAFEQFPDTEFLKGLLGAGLVERAEAGAPASK